jgi:hypothetical protein
MVIVVKWKSSIQPADAAWRRIGRVRKGFRANNPPRMRRSYDRAGDSVNADYAPVMVIVACLSLSGHRFRDPRGKSRDFAACGRISGFDARLKTQEVAIARTPRAVLNDARIRNGRRGAMQRTYRIGCAVGALAAAVALGGAKAPKPMASPAVVQSLLDCRKLTDSAERLACFDKASSAMESATASGDLVSIDREQRRAARRQAFGFILPSLSFLERGEKTEEDRITATVTEAGRNALDQWVITLDDGAVWRQTEAVELGRRPHKGSKVVISKGILGSFFMTIDGQGAGKAKRES